MFDDIEKLLAEEAAAALDSEVTSETITAETDNEESQSFNEAELEDIMAEIDSLEGDFETTENVIEASAVADLTVDSSQTNKTDLQMEIEKEIAMLDSEMGTIVEEDHDEIPEEVQNAFIPEVEEIETSTVLNFEKKTEIVPVVNNSTLNTKSEMSFTASGAMNLNLSFKIGNEEARLYIDEVKGLVVTLSGVELCLNETSGCSVTMENGVNFNIPLTSKESSSKKKAA